jgi:hypothetical protein
MERSDLPPHGTATYVLPKWKTVYVSVPKAACTSLKWLVAGLQGEDTDHICEGSSLETSRQMSIHIRHKWQHTPKLHDLDAETLAEIRPDNGWFIFGVARHPSARLWSGWQSKFLLQEPRFQDRYPDGPWPRVPETTADVVEDFQTFVRALTGDEPVSVADDRHFLDQVSLLRPQTVDYSRIYRTDELGLLLDDLERHLKPLGLETMPKLARSNETPLPPVRAAFGPEILELIQSRYARDFEQFGYHEPLPNDLAPADEYTTDQLVEVGRLVERAERIGNLYRMYVRARNNRRAADARVKRLRGQLAEAQAAPTIARRVKNKLRRGLARVSGR